MVSNIVITPEHCLDPRIAIAGCRAGEWGILDLGFRGERQATIFAVNRLASLAGSRGLWGVRWDTFGLPTRGVEKLSELLPRRAPLIVVAGAQVQDLHRAGPKAGDLRRFYEKLRHHAQKIFVEVSDLPSAQAAAEAGCDGLIVKGHEAGGWVGRQSTFILLQELHGRIDIPYWVQGGIGLHSAAAAKLAGAAGVTLREQLWLADESPFHSTPWARAWSQLDGSETVVLEAQEGLFRLYSRSGRDKLRGLEHAAIRNRAWREQLLEHLTDVDDPLISMGQDITFAARLAERYSTVGRILAALRSAVDSTIEMARTQGSLTAHSPLAQAHGTRFPIVQGPMTRVSDLASFAQAVAEGGALPCVALSVMRGPQAQALLQDTARLLGNRPWGVGILGFTPLELRKEQIKAICEVKPPFAIIGGGRPSQARELEALGVASYLHVPSPGLLQSFIAEGARKFVFEGSECGGHTGPRTSFVLWQSAIETLTAAKLEDPTSLHVLFAGGVHDALSAAMASVMAAPLVERGMKVGVIMGTAYLFTEEIVSTGALLEEFQARAIECQETVLLQSGVGIYTRCAQTPFCDEFDRVRRELILIGKPNDEILKRLELLNIGRLRIASKGLAHDGQSRAEHGRKRPVKVDASTQWREGMYMLGEVARFRSKPITIAELHAEISAGSGAILARDAAQAIKERSLQRTRPDEIAIIGMACLFPKASDLRAYWRNIVHGVDAIREVGEERWRPDAFFDPHRGTPDKVYSKWGGFLDDVQFDPTRYGIPPACLKSIEPMQLLALEVARLALEDAGLDRRPFPRARTATIFGAGGMHDLGVAYIFRTLLDHYLPKVPGLSDSAQEQITRTLRECELPKWTEDSFPGILGNVVAGRVANRLDLQGVNFSVDAACASSLAALNVGVKQLRDRDADLALVGAIDGTNNAVSFMAFAQTHALSPRGRCRPFDDSADGISIGEGVAVLALKRLDDAERDGDRIRAVIKGVGGSSDGRNRSLTAPHPQGQVAALRRAYEDAAVDPATVELIEAHGTGTAVGDKSEIEALGLAFDHANVLRQGCAIGSVKSMIGHTKVTAGLAGVVKGVLALEHRVLPPSIGVETPNSSVDFKNTPFFINSETRPWFASTKGHPRRCGVSAFGFGGTNFHVVLEEYRRGYRDGDFLDLGPRDVEPFVFCGLSSSDIAESIRLLLREIEPLGNVDLTQLAYSWHLQQRRAKDEAGACRLALLAGSTSDLTQKLNLALEMLHAKKEADIKHPKGVYFGKASEAAGTVCFLFPGQGSQKINMLRDLVVGLPELHGLFELADAQLAEHFPQRLSRYIYPLPAFSDEERARQQSELSATSIAQPGLGVVELAALETLRSFGLQPDFVAGHSYGEYVALCAGGVITPVELIRVSEIRGRLTAQAGQKSPGTVAAVNAAGELVRELIERRALDVSVANLNAPDQTIIAGSVEAIDGAVAALSEEGLRVARLPIGAAFHSPAMASARDGLEAQLADFAFRAPRIPVFSNSTARPYPETAEEIRSLLARHIREPVRFAEEIDALYKAGARIFIEVGPGRVLSGLVDRNLADQPHATLAIDAPGRSGWLQLAHLLAEAFALGCPVDFATWFKGRGLNECGVGDVCAEARAKSEPGAFIWRVNGGRAEPWRRPPVEPDVAPSLAAATTLAAETSSSVAPPATPVRILASAPPIANASATPANDHIVLNERLGMTDKQEMRNTGQPSLSPTSTESPVTQSQRNIAQFLELQRDQLETMRRFLDFQASLLELTPTATASASSVTARPSSAPHDVAASASPVILQSVPPTPVLPRRLLDGEPAETATDGRSAPAAPRAAENPPPRAGAAAEPAQRQLAPASGSSGGETSWATTEQFRADLLRAVSERTGYPEDMLDLDAHMEADLGIDSIKRIEVFSELKNRYHFTAGRDEETVFEELSGLKTLGAITGWYDGIRNSTMPESASVSASKRPALLPPASNDAVALQAASSPDCAPRYVLKPIPAFVDEGAELKFGPSNSAILLLGPVSRMSETLRAALIAGGHSVLLAIPGGETQSLGDDRFEIDLSSVKSLQKLKGLLAASRLPVGSIVSLLGLHDGGEVDERDRLDDAKALFLVAKVFEQELKDAADGEGGWVITVTSFDGQFGLSGAGDFSAGMAGVLGVAKTIAREWPSVRVKCIDIDPSMGPDEFVDNVLNEWRRQDRTLEVGFRRDGRWRLDLEPRAALAANFSELELDDESVLLVTGGARGVTASVVQALAQRCRPRIVLVGRSPAPEEESLATRDIVEPAQLRRFLIDDLRSKSPVKTTPRQIEREFERLLKNREIRANLAAMRASGAEVEYHALDVRDEEAFGRLIDEIYSKWGRIDGVIHGAGAIDDKLIRDKSLESFEAVYATKVAPAWALSRKLRPETLKFLVFFSSVAGRFGSAGQCDYSAANEVLNKLAERLSHDWLHVHTVSINWGPWDCGMASEELLRLYATRDIRPIAENDGVRYCLDELQRRNTGEVEIVIAESLEQIAAAQPRRSRNAEQDILATVAAQ